MFVCIICAFYEETAWLDAVECFNINCTFWKMIE